MTRSAPSHRMLERAGVAAAACWLAACAVLTVTRDRYGWPRISVLASSASSVAHGRVWTLLTSALPVSRFPVAELAGCALAVAAAIALLDGLRFWIVALASHVGSALIVYAGIGVVWLVDRGSLKDAQSEDDYGISAIWLGAVGAIAVVLHRRGRRRAGAALAALAVVASAALVAASDWMAFAEHLLALVIGAATALLLTPAPPRPAARRQTEDARSRELLPTRTAGS
jgi:hypothetical protein